MVKKLTTAEYFRYPESNRPMELVYGYVRERGVGRVGRADVVLDRDAALVVQPDLFYISNERLGMVDDRVWGAPDLVIEIASPSTELRDRTLKLEWFRRYGVRECWLVYPRERRIAIVDCEKDHRESFGGSAMIRSRVLPDLAVPAADCFDVW